ncbi:putative Dishevelled segment polarity protein DVL-3 [Schistosoma japonicum]|uniref:Putative Dishevelled segment polarity protein DVL-3 n=2 Tax=Schistosoma japonicum TaxID=6182 RepID=A0A4Z2D8W3_SCHJA|nr:Segment polarity protein dishevelled likeVL-3 [Schistosoma japonicum]TNN12913.1 putative Dishevelled segment polarity protein DVL-3 [Schistosoma japonicum]TNN12914.1 putative Dishevelled segment polarity protein DVL-3 [Schistosoma japonicum]
MDETKIIYHIDDEETPYLVKVAVCPSAVTLGDFKNALNRPNYKFFFKSVDADFGVVKEEIADDDARLPCFNGKVISWLVSADSSTKSDNHSTGTGENHFSSQNKNSTNFNKTSENIHSASKNEIPSEQEHAIGTTGHALEECDTCVETDSVYSGDRVPPLKNFHNYKHGSRLAKLGQRIQNYETSSSMMSSDLESTSFFDSEDESSRFSTATGTTMSSAKYARHRRQRRHRRILPIRRTSEDATSFSSVTDSTMSLNIITVTLNMDSVNFLGISIVGQSNKAGDGGIYVGSIMRGGAVAQDGRIEPGDMILEVNRISFEDMSNDEAVRVLREEVQKPGPITLVVAKCWDPSPKNYFTIPRQEPVRPIDPRAWVLHTNAMTGALGTPSFDGTSPFAASGLPATGMPIIPGHFMGMAPTSGLSVPPMPPGMPPLILPSLAGINTIPSSNMTTKSLPEVADGDGGYRSRGPASSGVVGGPGSTKTNGSRSGGETTVDAKGTQSLLSGANAKSSTSLTVASDMASVVHDMLMSDSGLEIRDRTWLKITIPNAFIGSELVDWLFTHVDGFADRRDARRYASNLLHYGYICHTVNKSTFSEQCYYTFGDIATTLSQLNLDEVDSVSEIGANSGPHAGTHPMMPQMYPHVHHVLPDASGGLPAGLSSVPSQNVSSNPNVGLMSSPIPGEGNSLAQTGSHYPYPPILYPIPSTAASSSSGPCHADANGIDCNFVNPNSSTHPGGLRNRVSNSGQMDVDSTMYPVNSTTIAPHTRSVMSNHTHVTTMIGSSNQRVQQQKVNNSSSSSSSHSSASSTSSSSTGCSGNRRVTGLPTNNTTQILNTNIPQSLSTPLDTTASKGLPSVNKVIQRCTDPSSVQSLSVSSHPCFCMPFIRKTLNSSHAANGHYQHSACKRLDTQREQQQSCQTNNLVHNLHEQDSSISPSFLSRENNNMIFDNELLSATANATSSTTTATSGCQYNSFSVQSTNQKLTTNVLYNIPTTIVTATYGIANNAVNNNDNCNNNAQSILLRKRNINSNNDLSIEHFSLMGDKIRESGTSSASSASRQNGTGASAAGSGSGSAVTTHVLSKLNNNNTNNLTNKSECPDNVQRTHGMDFTSSFRQTNCNLIKESTINNKSEHNQPFNHQLMTTTSGLIHNQR